MPAEAVKTLNLSADKWVDVGDPDERVQIDERDKERLALVAGIKRTQEKLAWSSGG